MECQDAHLYRPEVWGVEGKVARRRIREAYDQTAHVRPLRVVREDEAG
jgi:hypothetical protein